MYVLRASTGVIGIKGKAEAKPYQARRGPSRKQREISRIPVWNQGEEKEEKWLWYKTITRADKRVSWFIEESIPNIIEPIIPIEDKSLF